MITRQTYIQKFIDLDFSFFQNEYPSIYFLMRCASDYGYVEQIAQGRINSENDAQLKAAGEIIKKGIDFIPVVGDILSMLANIGGIDLSAFGSISDSGIARQRLFEWVQWINNYYTKNQYGMPDLPIVNQKFIRFTGMLINARPKCMSPTGGCSKEHKQYIARTQLLKDSQQTLYNIYYNYCVNDTVFTNWLQGVKVYNKFENPNPQDVKTSLDNSKLLLLLGAGLLLSKKF